MTKPTEEQLERIIRPMPRASYEVHCHFSHLERQLEGFEQDYGLDLMPDFQRGHVWTQEQQERWIEAVLRGAISTSGLTIQFNSPAFGHGSATPSDQDLPDTVVCVDGLQRLTSVRRFMRGEIRAFGFTRDDLAGTSFDPKRMTYRLNVAIHAFKTRQQVLQYYLDINTGGTPHSAQELERVRSLLDQEIDSFARPAAASRPKAT